MIQGAYYFWQAAAAALQIFSVSFTCNENTFKRSRIISRLEFPSEITRVVHTIIPNETMRQTME